MITHGCLAHLTKHTQPTTRWYTCAHTYTHTILAIGWYQRTRSILALYYYSIISDINVYTCTICTWSILHYFQPPLCYTTVSPAAVSNVRELDTYTYTYSHVHTHRHMCIHKTHTCIHTDTCAYTRHTQTHTHIFVSTHNWPIHNFHPWSTKSNTRSTKSNTRSTNQRHDQQIKDT